MDLAKSFLQNDGFGIANQAVLEDLTKALQAGSGTDSAAFTGGRALIPESLDKTLVNVLWGQKHAKLFKALKKNSVPSVVHEWNKRTGVGDEDGAWVPEGGSTFEKNQEIVRKTLQMKYLQTKRSATLQAVTANTLEGAEAIEANAGTLWIIKQTEKSFYEGNSQIVAEQPDGLDVLIPQENVIDLRGKTANSVEFEDAMAKGARKIYDFYGLGTDLYASTAVMEDVQARLRDRLRFGAGTNAQGRAGSARFERYPTNHGDLQMESNVFIQAGVMPNASTITDKRPDTPTFTVAKANSTSKFGSTDEGTYYYNLMAVNKYGNSVAGTPASVAVVEDDIVTITITNVAALVSSGATGIRVLRSKKDGDVSTIKEIKGLLTPAVPASIDDENEDLPGTSSAYILNLDPAENAIRFDQFLPLMKFPLYPTDAAIYPFLMLLFGALELKKEEHMVRIKNISSSDDV